MALRISDWLDDEGLNPPAGSSENGLIGRSPAMRRLFGHIESISGSDATVLLEGETGVGKNRVARLIHQISPRAARPFVAFNAATLSEELFESELFGHVKGAFTGAYDHHKGLARVADGGTLFIDEVGELSLPNQSKLLSFLDHKQVRPVGGLRPFTVDLRLIAATNQDLRVRVRSGAFRRDLYYRIRVFPLQVPSLRERPEDVPIFARHFLARHNGKYGKQVRGFTREAMQGLRTGRWEGNVRELENVIERAVVLTPDGAAIELRTLALEEDALCAEPADAEATSLRASREGAERQLIDRALRRGRWNVSAAARELGISRVGLTRKLKQLGLRRPGTST
ncbi:MAG TPA: sigma-54 dependent transcriptional regulator [Thermoanaerobaculia bacterium]|jgi:two-component system response regulator HydG